MRTLITTLLILLASINLWSQASDCGCPLNEADLSDGGTFCGECEVRVGEDFSINEKVVWNGGTLKIIALNGKRRLNDTLHIVAGTIEAVQGSEGSIKINDGGVLLIDQGAGLYVDNGMKVMPGGQMRLNGDLVNEEKIDIETSANVYIGPYGKMVAGANHWASIDLEGEMIVEGGSIMSHDLDIVGKLWAHNAFIDMKDDDISVKHGGIFHDEGSVSTCDQLTIEGTLTTSGKINVITDVELDGGELIIEPYGGVYAQDDMKAENGSTIDLKHLGDLEIEDNFVNNSLSNGTGVDSKVNLFICDTMKVGGDFTLENTFPDSEFCGCETGALIVSGDFVFTERVSCGIMPCESGEEGCFYFPQNPLPIKWLGFKAKTLGQDAVELKWSTAAEINNRGFYIERADETKIFEEIAFVKGGGNQWEASNYSYTDINQLSGTVYYRIRQEDFDGKTEYSGVQTIQKYSYTKVLIYPNPVTTQLNIELDAQHDDQLILRDQFGTALIVEPTQNRQKISLEIPPSLSAGVYFLSHPTNNGMQTKRIMVNR